MNHLNIATTSPLPFFNQLKIFFNQLKPHLSTLALA
jgi:hypothetical protein